MSANLSSTGRRSFDDWLAGVHEFAAILRETLIIIAVLLVLLFPSTVGSYLAGRGVKSVAFAGTTIDLTQFDSTRVALNAVNAAADTLNAQPQLQSSLQTAAGQLSQALATQVRSISAQNPNVLPQDGWMYLGTVNQAKTSWRSGITPTIQDRWPVKLDDVVTLATDTNLHADSASDDRPKSHILSVLPAGTKARIYAIDSARPVPPGDRAAPGFRVWAHIRVVQ